MYLRLLWYLSKTLTISVLDFVCLFYKCIKMNSLDHVMSCALAKVLFFLCQPNESKCLYIPFVVPAIVINKM